MKKFVACAFVAVAALIPVVATALPTEPSWMKITTTPGDRLREVRTTEPISGVRILRTDSEDAMTVVVRRQRESRYVLHLRVEGGKIAVVRCNFTLREGHCLEEL